MTVNINAANISSVQLAAAQTPSAPNSGFVRLHHNANSRLAMRPATGNVVEFLGNTSGSGAGITFPATQSPSTDANTLDDYEEGTYTPTVVGAGTAGNPSFSIQTGRYTKIGNVVFVHAIVSVSSNTTGTGNARISLPTAVGNAANAPSFLTWTATVDWPSGSNVIFKGTSGQAYAELYAYGDDISTAAVTDLVGYYEINGFYFV